MRSKKVRVALIVVGVIGFIFSLSLLFEDRKIVGGIGLVIYALIVAAGFSKNLGEKVQHSGAEKPVVKKEKPAIVTDPKVITKSEKPKKEKIKKERPKKEKIKKEKAKKEKVQKEKPQVNISNPSKEKISYIKHSFYNNTSLSYDYISDFTPVNLEAIHALVSDCSPKTNHQFKWELCDNKVKLMYGGVHAGDLYFKHDMFSDYAKRGDPVVVYLNEADGATGDYKVEIAFFRDKKKQYKYREQTVVALTAYKSDDCQDTISTMEYGDEIEIERDDENEKYIAVYGDRIGNIPSKIGKRLEEQEPVYVIFEKAIAVAQREDYTDIYEPYIRIYW